MEFLHPAKVTDDERERILDRIGRAASAIASVRVAIAFGSFARGEDFRDIDVVLVLDEPFTWRAPGRVADDLVAAVGATPRPLDVVVLNTAPATFRLRVLDEGRVLFGREPREARELWVRAKSETLDLDAWHRARAVERT